MKIIALFFLLGISCGYKTRYFTRSEFLSIRIEKNGHLFYLFQGVIIQVDDCDGTVFRITPTVSFTAEPVTS